MDNLTITRCPIAVLESSPNIGDLMAEYSRESAIDGLGDAKADWSLYHSMEDVGMLHTIAAYLDDELIGFVLLLVSPNAHFSIKLGVTESIFVAAKHRRTGAGMRLIRAAEAAAVELGAVGLFVSSPKGGRLACVLPRAGYESASISFFKALA